MPKFDPWEVRYHEAQALARKNLDIAAGRATQIENLRAALKAAEQEATELRRVLQAVGETTVEYLSELGSDDSKKRQAAFDALVTLLHSIMQG